MQKLRFVVSKAGDGDFQTIEEAVRAINDLHKETVTIFIKAGIYEEKLWIRKENLVLEGESAESTIIRYGDGANKLRPDGREYGTFNTATVLFAGRDITVKNLTIENTAGEGSVAGQALAVYIASDRTAFYNCRLLGHQDTIFNGEVKFSTDQKYIYPSYFLESAVPVYYENPRNYFENCYVSGDVDFIFGSNTVYFKHCEIFSHKREGKECSYITAANTPLGQEYGYVFYECKLTSDDKPGSVYLGRPWRDYAKTAFVRCELGNHIHKAGWHNWNKPRAEVMCSYVEFENTGAGSEISSRASFSRQLSNPSVADYYTKEQVLAGEDGWLAD